MEVYKGSKRNTYRPTVASRNHSLKSVSVAGIMILIVLIHLVQLYTTQIQLYVLQIIGELHMKMCVAIQYVLKGCPGAIQHAFIGVVQHEKSDGLPEAVIKPVSRQTCNLRR
jgi:hypothetical protein